MTFGSRFGELVQWDTSPHDWLEGRAEEMLINMIDDATSRWFARFVTSDSTVENMNLLEQYVQKHGRPLAYYIDKASLFQTAVKTKRDGNRKGKDREELPPTQIGRALQELAIPWLPAHSPQRGVDTCKSSGKAATGADGKLSRRGQVKVVTEL